MEDIANPFKTYSCRFEFTHDYTGFVVAADKQGLVINTSELSHPSSSPDCFVEFKVEAELDVLQGILRDGPDLHVALQTLRPVPLNENSLERDWSL